MKTQLINIKWNGSSSGTCNNNSNSNNNNNSNNNDDIRRITVTITDDSTLCDLIRSDRSLVIFLMVLGFYIDDERNSYAVKIVARIWQIFLLLFGAIGFGWRAFIFGGYYICQVYDLLTSSSTKSIGIFISFGNVLGFFIVPITQVASLILGINSIYRRLGQPVNTAIVSPLLASCKRITLVFFVCMALLVIAINPIEMTRSYYENEIVDNYDDGILIEHGQQTYSMFKFNRFTTSLVFNLSVACYLSVMLLFTSLTMMHIITIQDEVVTILSVKTSDTFNLDEYLKAKEKIVSLKNGSSFSTQLLMLTAGINMISFMFHLWYYHYSFIQSYSINTDDEYFIHLTYSGMIVKDLYLVPYLLKGIHIISILIIIIIIEINIIIIITRDFVLLLYFISSINN